MHELGGVRLREMLSKQGRAARRGRPQRRPGQPLAEMLDVAGKHREAVAAMQERAQVLEKAAAAAPDATMASTFDAHRTDTYLYLKEPQKAEQLSPQREKEMPDDYNPPARLARVLFEEKKLPEAESGDRPRVGEDGPTGSGASASSG